MTGAPARPSRTFAERLREAVNDTPAQRATARERRHRQHSVFSATANPTRVRHSDELFVERIRQAMD